ncbi:MAG: glycosyltransferase family 4 protein [Chloroflexota bacterium]|nr:glycosyltransferase family 4 protein [Chloroflexota bacterium]
MRILHLVHQYMPEHVGGTELYTRWLTHALSQRGHQVTIFYRRSAKGIGREDRMEEGVHVWAAWAGLVNPARRFLATFRDWPIERTFELVLEEVNPDLVHIEHLMGLPVTLIRSIRRRDIPYLITLWDFWWVCANAQLLTNYSQQVCDGPKLYLNCARCALARAASSRLWPVLPPVMGMLAERNRLLRRGMKASGGLIAPTEFVRRWYIEHHAPAEKLLTLQPGLGPATFVSPQKQRPNGPVRFAYIGGLSWQKGIHTIVEAFGGIHGPGELWIAGDESFDPTYVALLRAQATPGVRFLGRLAREEVWETLAQVDVVLVPSLWYETFSFILSEAFIAGVPVIASRLGPLADRVRDGVDGLLIPPGDVDAWRAALQRLLDEPDLLARLRANVHPPMTLEEHVDQLELLYAQLVCERPQQQSSF